MKGEKYFYAPYYMAMGGLHQTGQEISELIAPEDSGQRLDHWIAKRAAISVKRAKLLFSDGQVRYNGKRAKKGQTTAAGDRVEFVMPDAQELKAVPDENVAVEVIHEDASLVVISKPAGIPTHPLKPDEKGTVANFLVAHYPEMAEFGYEPRQPGILHRLDVGTSGLLLAARDEQTFTQLREALDKGIIEKHYRALSGGQVTRPLVVGYPIAPDAKDPKRVMVCRTQEEVEKHGGQQAFSYIVGLAPCGAATSLRIVVGTAKRHQIRAHLAEIGHPLVGDEVYGGPMVEGLDHHLLHAEEIAFFHPVTNDLVRFRVELPEKYLEVRETLRRNTN